MSVRKFVDETIEVSKRFAWIKHSTIEETTTWASIRLWLNDSFVEIFYRRKTGNISYAYIEKRKRVFGANNMRIGWHLHPFERVEKHKPIEPLSVEEFLRMLEDELEKRRKI